MKKKIALIFGITGQDGSYLSEFLIRKNYIVHGVKRRSSSINTKRVDHIYQDPLESRRNFFLHYGDITDSSSVSQIISDTKPDEIYNLAAQSHVAVSFEVPEYTANADALGALRILEAIKFAAPWGLLDQFTKQKLVDAYVKDRKDFKLVSRTKAESDPVVAAASIIARAVYVREMKRLSDEFGETLVKGASGRVLEQAKKIFEEKGADGLKGFAKMHFKTAYEAQGLEPPAKPSWYKY